MYFEIHSEKKTSASELIFRCRQRGGSHLGLLGGDAVDGETSLHIINETEVLTGLLNADNVCEHKRKQVILVLGFFLHYRKHS